MKFKIKRRNFGKQINVMKKIYFLKMICTFLKITKNIKNSN